MSNKYLVTRSELFERITYVLVEAEDEDAALEASFDADMQTAFINTNADPETIVSLIEPGMLFAGGNMNWTIHLDSMTVQPTEEVRD